MASHNLVLAEVREPTNKCPRQRSKMELATLRSWDLIDLPLKKRTMVVLQAREHNRYLCKICGRTFTTIRALGYHKGHHTRKQVHLKVDEDYELDYRCISCSRSFNTRKGIGQHKRHCKGPPPVEEEKDGALRII